MTGAELIKIYKKGERDLRYANLSGSDLSGSDLSGSDLRYSNLSGSDLSGSDLSGSDLSGSDFRHSDLRGANFRGADLRYANFRHSDLSGSDLRHADLSGANLSESMGLEYAQCSWFGHGECGRRLLAVRIDNEIIFYCGCFRGNARALIDYIIAGEEKYRSSRYKALNFLMSCFREQVKK